MHFFINDYEEVLFLTNIIIIIIIIIHTRVCQPCLAEWRQVL